ncbi:MAG TPA: ABC transporter permease [Casimicrobiaceae bacterium]|nr:ABC transporter permease [Casimicrobiaceae bacterium]
MDAALTIGRRRTHRARNLKAWSIGAVSVIALLVLWYVLTDATGVVTSIQFPSPSDAWDSLVQLVGPGYADGTLARHIGSSITLVLMGFVIAVGTGVPLGLLMGLNRLADAFFNPVFQLLRPIAPIAWIPLTILWFGLGTPAKLFVIWLASFAPALINTYTGVRNIDPVVLAAARVHGAGAREMLFDVVLPAALPTIFTGLRLSLQACWMVLVAAELVGSITGLGHIMIIATRDLNPGMIFIGMVSVAVLGVLLTLVLALVERMAIPWRQ